MLPERYKKTKYSYQNIFIQIYNISSLATN